MQLNENSFFENFDLNQDEAIKITTNSLKKFDDGELFLEYSNSESFVLDDGRIKSTTANQSSGLGLRGIMGETSAYAHSSIISAKSLQKAGNIINGCDFAGIDLHPVTNGNFGSKLGLYEAIDPINNLGFKDKVDLLFEIDSYVRSKNSFVKQVSVSLSGEMQLVSIINKFGKLISDIRPLVRLNVSVALEKNGRIESAASGIGGRELYQAYVDKESWQQLADRVLREAEINLESIPAPAGTMTVVLGSGWPGVLLHEAIGHGLEGDYIRKGTSAFSQMRGKQVASKGITIVDDGTINKRRGSLNIDDEGNTPQNTTLIEDGILVNFMKDKLTARMMKEEPTGNGRRESYKYQPMTRMTNTYMLPGQYEREEIIKSVKNGIYAENFGGGQVDITSGKFVFSASLAYLIEDGKITKPIKGATLIGNGPDILTKVSMVGNDSALDTGVGTCGKQGQSVPVGVGQPTLKVDGLTVGGTDL